MQKRGIKMIGFGQVFKIDEENKIIDGCTVSAEDLKGAAFFALAAHTDISPEIYRSKKLIVADRGALTVYNGGGFAKELKENQAILIREGEPVGMKTESGAIYTEITIRSDSKMNKAVEAGNVFSLKDLVPYQPGRIVNMDVASNEKMKFVVMAFDKGTGLSEHAAPGEALIFALDGEGIIGYEGKEYPIKAGENFKFAKQGRHYVKANGQFKMALLLTLE